jgi:hypothetical protein
MFLNIERAVTCSHPVVRRMLKPLSSEVEWREIGLENAVDPWGDPATFVEFAPDSNAGFRTRSQRQIGVIRVPSAQLEVLKAAYPGHKEALARRVGKVVRVGILPEGMSFGVDSDMPDKKSIAFPIGLTTEFLDMGLWVPGERFIEPQVSQWGDRSTIGEIEARTPNMPIVRLR